MAKGSDILENPFILVFIGIIVGALVGAFLVGVTCASEKATIQKAADQANAYWASCETDKARLTQELDVTKQNASVSQAKINELEGKLQECDQNLTKCTNNPINALPATLGAVRPSFFTLPFMDNVKSGWLLVFTLPISLGLGYTLKVSNDKNAHWAVQVLLFLLLLASTIVALASAFQAIIIILNGIATVGNLLF